MQYTLVEDIAVLERQLIEAQEALAVTERVRDSAVGTPMPRGPGGLIKNMDAGERREYMRWHRERQEQGRVYAQIAALQMNIESLMDQIGRLLQEVG